MRIVIVWHAGGADHGDFRRLAEIPGVTLTILIPERWDLGLLSEARPPATSGPYSIRALPVAFPFRRHEALAWYRGLDAALSELRPDVVYSLEEPYSVMGWQVARWKDRHAPRTRLVFACLQNIPKRYPYPFRRMMRRVFAASDGAVACNSEVVEVLRGWGYVKDIELTPLGIEPEIFRPVERGALAVPWAEARFVVGYVGRLIEAKGVRDLLEAFMRARIRGAVLVFVGGGPEEAALRTASAGRDNVHFIPAVPRSELAAWYAAFDVLVLPSRTRPRWKEQFGRVLAEAMACGTPVVGSDSGSIPEVIGGAGRVFPEGDVEALARTLTELADNPAMRDSLRDQGLRRFTEAYDARAVMTRLHRFLTAV